VQHVEEIFNVDLRLLYFSEQSSHVKQRSSQLHEESIDHHEVTCGHRALAHVICRHRQVSNHTNVEDEALT